MMTAKLIQAGALRQFRHNDSSEGFVMAYDKAITDREFASWRYTDKEKHHIADSLALWLSASMDQHAANDEMRKHIRAWLDFQTSELMHQELSR